jgi:hypothetical protein
VHEHPKRIRLRIAGYDEETDDEIHALSVAYFWKEVGDALEDILELFTARLR